MISVSVRSDQALVVKMHVMTYHYSSLPPTHPPTLCIFGWWTHGFSSFSAAYFLPSSNAYPPPPLLSTRHPVSSPSASLSGRQRETSLPRSCAQSEWQGIVCDADVWCLLVNDKTGHLLVQSRRGRHQGVTQRKHDCRASRPKI